MSRASHSSLTASVLAMLLLSSQAVPRTPRPYQFSYRVEDLREGLQYQAQEASDGTVVTGGYEVRLPGSLSNTAIKR